jgi:hypothetical protein
MTCEPPVFVHHFFAEYQNAYVSVPNSGLLLQCTVVHYSELTHFIYNESIILENSVNKLVVLEVQCLHSKITANIRQFAATKWLAIPQLRLLVTRSTPQTTTFSAIPINVGFVVD